MIQSFGVSKFSKIKTVTIVTLCHNLKSQKSNFYNWISITWQNSIGCKPIRSEYFDWVAYWCSRGQNFISDFLLLYTGSHDSPLWLITDFMSHIGKHYQMDQIERVFRLNLIRSWSCPIRERKVSIWKPTIKSTSENVPMMAFIGWPIRSLKITYFIKLTRETCCNLIWWFATILCNNL